MIIIYNFNDNDFEYEPSTTALYEVKNEILQGLSKSELIEIIMAGDDIEECFYNEFKECFEDKAYEAFKDLDAYTEPPYRPDDFI